MNRIKCETCQRWSHLGCTFLTSSDKNALSRTYFCTVKCELQSLPFYTVKNEDLDIFVKQKRQHGDCKIVPQHKRKNKFSEIDYSNKKPTTDFIPQCEYIDTNHINDEFMRNTGNFGYLNVFHCNLASANKNLKRVEELFRECTRMPDIIGVSETKYKIEKDIINLEDYKFEGCPTQTAGGAGIYICNDYSYNIRNDLCLKGDYCEDKWVEMNFKESRGKQNTKAKGKTLVVGIVYRHPEY